eukprot:Clim_evm21s218 gene=Clim_evmTU21s218
MNDSFFRVARSGGSKRLAKTSQSKGGGRGRSKTSGNISKPRRYENETDNVSDDYVDDEDDDLGVTFDSDDEERRKRDRADGSEYDDDTEDEKETAQEKRIRLAKSYLSKLAADKDEYGEDRDVDAEVAITRRLADDALDRKGRLVRSVAGELEPLFTDPKDENDVLTLDIARFTRGHHRSPTCIAVDANGTVAFTGGKDAAIVRWELKDGMPCRTHFVEGKPSATQLKKRQLKRERALQAQLARRIKSEGLLPDQEQAETMKRNKAVESRKVDRDTKPADRTSSGHAGAVFAIAVHGSGMSDRGIVASGGADAIIRLWRATDLFPLGTLDGHRGAITSLTFRLDSAADPQGTLYSTSRDKLCKVWSAVDQSYIETLFGHQEPAQWVAAHPHREQCLTAGGQERCLRLWKIPEESHLVFLLTNVGAECCCFVGNGDHFVSGGDDGSISLWNVSRKKPLVTVRPAHHDQEQGRNDREDSEDTDEGDHSNTVDMEDNDGDDDEQESVANSKATQDLRLNGAIIGHQSANLDYSAADPRDPRLSSLLSSSSYAAANADRELHGTMPWVTALAAVPKSDLVASGSSDGLVKLWRVDTEGRSLDEIGCIAVNGFINGLAWSSTMPPRLVASVSQEHRFGRWENLRKVRNGMVMVDFKDLLKGK